MLILTTDWGVHIDLRFNVKWECWKKRIRWVFYNNLKNDNTDTLKILNNKYQHAFYICSVVYVCVVYITQCLRCCLRVCLISCKFWVCNTCCMLFDLHVWVLHCSVALKIEIVPAKHDQAGPLKLTPSLPLGFWGRNINRHTAGSRVWRSPSVTIAIQKNTERDPNAAAGAVVNPAHFFAWSAHASVLWECL